MLLMVDLLKEKDELKEILTANDFIEVFNNFKVEGMEGKEVVGFMSSHNDVSFINKHFNLQAIHRSIRHTNFFIKKSLDKALENIYIQDYKKVELFQPANEFEMEAIFYVENAIFRTVVLWDLLGQLYNEYFNIGVSPRSLYYKGFFKKQKQEELANNIFMYLEKKDLEVDGEMKGHHKFISDYRNKMTHRNSPSVTTLSSFDHNIRLPMRFVNYRVIKDYEKVTLFIQELLTIIETDYKRQI